VKSRDNVRFRLKVRRAEAFYEDETVLMGTALFLDLFDTS
jgi:hypothetical protein